MGVCHTEGQRADLYSTFLPLDGTPPACYGVSSTRGAFLYSFFRFQVLLPIPPASALRQWAHLSQVPPNIPVPDYAESGLPLSEMQSKQQTMGEFGFGPAHGR
jgi:hypothetical protein